MTPYTEHKDEILVELTLLGNQVAFEELVSRYESSVLGTAYKITENQYSAQDASQDAFVSAWMNLDRLKSRDKFGSWVCSIAKNKAKNIVAHYRSTIPDISLDVLKITSLSSEEEEQNPDMLALSNLSGDDEKEELHMAIEALGEKIREAIKLHYFEGLSILEISRRLEEPTGTVKWRLSEGRKQLRKEYGIMEKTYDDKESILTRVMRQVEQLKLWRLKDDKDGLESEYRNVLECVDNLEESKEKNHALADVLQMGYWWVPGEMNDKILARMKEAALKSHNDEVMETVFVNEAERYSGKEFLDFVKNIQIPFLVENGFVKTLAHRYFWYGYECLSLGMYEECINSYKKVLEILTPEDVYYANALAAIELEEKIHSIGLPNEKFAAAATGETYKLIDGKWHFWAQPGYSRGYLSLSSSDSIFFNCQLIESIIYDPEMKLLDVKTSKDGNKLTFTKDGIRVETPAGIFENCKVYTFEGCKYDITYCETTFCPGVGIVKQTCTRHHRTDTWELLKYRVLGNTKDCLPFSASNKWIYTVKANAGEISEIENVFEVVSANEDTVNIKAYCLAYLNEYADKSWRGNMLSSRNGYVAPKDGKEKLSDVSHYMARALELASTKREKIQTKIADEVMKRIFETDPDYNPNYTEKGRWNFFETIWVNNKNGKISLEDDRYYSFEWKDMENCGNEGWKVLYSFLYDIIFDATGYVWNDEWEIGYHIEKDIVTWDNKTNHLVLDVLDGGEVVTKAGKFENCRQISLTYTGPGGGYNYRGGKMDYWFAKDVGIVKFSRLYGKDNSLDCIWELVDFSGTGEGYFPTDDQLFRRYEPTELGNGWHGSVEYTFDHDESGTVLFRNALGNQDRANYEADIEARKNKQ